MVYPQWWANQREIDPDDSLSIIDLVNHGTIDCKLAALLWLLMEHRASLLVASAPSFAGKTTLMHALLDFLPPQVRQIPLQGHFEDFAFLSTSKAQESYLVTEEISNHQYEYLWGYKAIKAFTLLYKGYSLGGTIHARNAEDSVYLLARSLGLPLNLLTKLGIVVELYARNGRTYEDEPIRKVVNVSLVVPDKEGLAIQVLANRQPMAPGFDYQPESVLHEALSRKGLIGKTRVNAEIETREHFLRHLRKTGKTTRKQVRKAVLGFYGQREEGL
jgi:hypothetical protein